MTLEGLQATDLPPRPASVPIKPLVASQRRSSSQQPSRGREAAAFIAPDDFLRLSSTVVARRKGAVLSRGHILKTDHYASGRALDLDFSLQGAPNFRAAAAGLNVYGTAQPKLAGIRTILSMLACFGKAPSPRNATWISTREEPMIYIGGRSYVLRDSERPVESISLSDRAAHLEEIESRLKQDILEEGRQYHGVILVHEELPNGKIAANWLAADEVKTVKELFESVREEGYHVQYHRLPIGATQDPESNYLDAYLNLMRNLPTDECLVFNCGMGVTRTTYAMTAALLVRRKRMMIEGKDDPLATPEARRRSIVSASNPSASKGVEEASRQQAASRCTLQLMDILHRSMALDNRNANLIEMLTSQSTLLQDLRNAVFGKYDIVLQLLACLENGLPSKELVDFVIDQCSTVVNLRNTILEQRISLASKSISAQSKHAYQKRAIKALERYFFLIAFAAYIDDSEINREQRFFDWVRARDEIRGMIRRLRTSQSMRAFSPVEDLSALTRVEAGESPTLASGGHLRSLSLSGNEPAGEEVADIIVARRQGIALRPGTILKRDLWRQHTPLHSGENDIRGALNFRRVPDSNVYALAQPTEDGINCVYFLPIQKARCRLSDRWQAVLQGMQGDMIWINLREEPLLYINSKPYVLRSSAMSLRNTQDFAGISSNRLELLENRLKADVQAELRHFDGRLLLHQEGADGSVLATWESTRSEDVKTLRECMEGFYRSRALQYYRLPVTAEKPPDFHDIAELTDIVRKARHNHGQGDTGIIVNCQLGQGRSTQATVLILMTQHWLAAFYGRHFALKTGHARPYSRRRFFLVAYKNVELKKTGFQIVNNLLRVVKNGSEVKATVDHFIGQCGEQLDLLENILACRKSAEEAAAGNKAQFIAKGLLGLKRYWRLLLLAIYFNECSPSSDITFQAFVASRPVFETLQAEFDDAGLHTLRPLGPAVEDSKHESEIQKYIAERHGRVLTSSTILKSDFFSGLQKKMAENVQGSPNFRRVPIKMPTGCAELEIYGTGMPSRDGLRNALKHMDAHPTGARTIFFQSLREEPVLYVAARPHVLRISDAPFDNIITTGVTAQRVMSIEDALKEDVKKELIDCKGQILLHDESEQPSGGYDLSAEWVAAYEDDIQTVAQVFESAKRDDYKVDFLRLPVTDEQSPLPLIFAALEERVVRGLSQYGPNDKLGFAFNCQMGRGRTTTAMVIAALVVVILFEGEIPQSQPAKEETDYKSDESQVWDESRENIYLGGDYRQILQLLSVLTDGKTAKHHTDVAIDAMAAIQNLREAVYSYKLRSEAAEEGSSSQRKTAAVGLNYLSRYGMLISFADYLLTRKREAARLDAEYTSKFGEFIEKRKEISNILAKRTFA